MKKLFVYFLLLVVPVLVHAQEVKVKKGKVLVNGTQAALVDSPYRDHYVFSTLSGDKQFTVQLDGEAFTDANIMHYLKVTNADESVTTEIEYEVLVTSFKVERIIAYLLAVKYHLIDESGINQKELDAFFEKERESLGDKYKGIVVKEAAAEEEKQQRYAEIKAKYDPHIESDNSITFKDYKVVKGKVIRKKVMGKIVAKPWEMGSKDFVVQVSDLNYNMVANLYFSGASREYTVKTWDDKEYAFVYDGAYHHQNKQLLETFVVDLMDKGYMLGHQIKEQSKALHAAKVQLAKERSVNVYGKKGYLIDDDGTKYEGTITVLFQQLDVNETGQKLPEDMGDSFGQKVHVKYVNEKGRAREKTFNAKNENRFYITDDEGNEQCFYGVKTKGEAMKKLQNISSFKLNNAYYYLLLEEGNGVMLLQDPVETEKYVIKIATEDKGQMIDSRSNEKLSEALAEYLGACKALAAEINKGAFDVTLESSLRTIVKEYGECSK